MRESGRVVKKFLNNIVEVELQKTLACAKCGMCAFNDTGIMTMEAIDEVGVLLGDNVELEIPEESVVLSALMVFILPLVAFFVGFVMQGLVLALIFLTLYLMFLYVYDRKAATMPRIVGRIVKVQEP